MLVQKNDRIKPVLSNEKNVKRTNEIVEIITMLEVGKYTEIVTENINAYKVIFHRRRKQLKEVGKVFCFTQYNDVSTKYNVWRLK